MLNHPLFILWAAFGLDLLAGDPEYPLHPVRLFGRLIQQMEKILRRHCHSLTIASWLLPLLCIGFALTGYLILHDILSGAAWLLNLLTVYSLLALKDLMKHADDVREALADQNISLARTRVQRMVGRDAARLDPYGVARAAIESTAENFVDGFLAPAFWYTLGALLFNSTEGGVALLIAFKMASTLDSMVGYKNERYLVLGRISARLDDLMNFIPARLSIPLIALCSDNRRDAWRIGWRDRLKHASPNSAHAEAAMAGALGLRLGGPTVYSYGTVDKPWLGDGSPEADARCIAGAIRLVRRCGTASLLFFSGLLLAALPDR